MIRKPNGRELMVGVISDPLFGPVISFGAGGTAVEVLGDRAIALPPLNGFLVRELISGTRIAKLLGSFRHMPPVQMEALESLLLRVSEMVCELPWLKEMDINPLIVDEHGAAGGRCARSGGLCAGLRRPLRPHGDLSLPGPPGHSLAIAGWHRCHHSSDAPRRRCDRTGICA